MIFVVLLLPSAHFAWQYRDMPWFGRLHDDSLMFTTAKSVANGEGYRIQSLPETPFQTKYPPLYTLYLSLIWLLNPQFPGNLALATLFNWLTLPVMFALGWAFFRQSGFSDGAAAGMTAILAISPYLFLFGVSLFSETFFTCVLLATFLIWNRKGLSAAFIAGLMGGACYLTRTAAVPLLVAIPLCSLWQREWRRGAAFLAGMMPFMVGWAAWTHAYRISTNEPSLVYYTDYLGFFLMNVGLDDIGTIVRQNFDQLVYSTGSLLLPRVVGSPVVAIAARMAGLGMFFAVWRLARRGVAAPYALYALGYAAVLAIWHASPTERFIIPLYPLLIAAAFVLIGEWMSALRHGWRSGKTAERSIAAVVSAGAVLLAVAAVSLQLYGALRFVPGIEDGERASAARNRSAYAWMRQNLPPSATVLSNRDPVLFLYTGLRGNAMPLMPRPLYLGNYQPEIDAFRNVAQYCRSRGFDYFYSTADDLDRSNNGLDVSVILAGVRSNPDLIPVYSGDAGTVYRVRPAGP